jgi:hypothetical protein
MRDPHPSLEPFRQRYAALGDRKQVRSLTVCEAQEYGCLEVVLTMEMA